MNDDFKNEFSIFKSEVGIAAQHYYSFKELNKLAKRRKIYDQLNNDAGFWNIHIHAVQLTYFIVLYRIFDTGLEVHGVQRLLKIAEENLGVFSKQSLKARRLSLHGQTEWLDNYIKNSVPLTRLRLKEIRRYLSKYRKHHQKLAYARNRYYAHKICVDKLEARQLFGSIELKKIEGIIQALANIVDVFEQSYENGRKRRLNQPNNFWKKHAAQETRKMILKYCRLRK